MDHFIILNTYNCRLKQTWFMLIFMEKLVSAFIKLKASKRQKSKIHPLHNLKLSCWVIKVSIKIIWQGRWQANCAQHKIIISQAIWDKFVKYDWSAIRWHIFHTPSWFFQESVNWNNHRFLCTGYLELPAISVTSHKCASCLNSSKPRRRVWWYVFEVYVVSGYADWGLSLASIKMKFSLQ